MSNLSRRLSVLLVLGFSGPSLAQGWIEFTSQIDRFGVNFPGEPEVQEFDYLSAFDAVFPARIYSAQTGENRFSATVVDFSDSFRIHSEMDKTEAATGPTNWLYDQRASVARAAREFRQRGSEVTYDGWGHIERVEGQQLQLTNPDGTRTFAGIYLHNPARRLYVLEATVPAISPSPALFQQSLGFLDEYGNRVRYQRGPDGGVIRIR